MIAVIDYGVGNLYSLTSSLKYIGAEVQVTNKAEDLKAAEKIILPGVGAFEDAIKKLRATGLVETLDAQVAAGKTLMGICLGMLLRYLGNRRLRLGMPSPPLVGAVVGIDPVLDGRLCVRCVFGCSFLRQDVSSHRGH